MRKLYEIEDDLANLIELDADRFVSGETGEIISREAFDALQVEWKDKVEAVALGYKNEKAEAEAIKAEIANLKERMERHERRADGYKQFLTNVLNGQKFETAKASCNWRKSEVVEIGCDVRTLPELYLKYADPKPDKTLLKKDIKAGKVIPGVAVVVKNNMSIK